MLWKICTCGVVLCFIALISSFCCRFISFRLLISYRAVCGKYGQWRNNPVNDPVKHDVLTSNNVKPNMTRSFCIICFNTLTICKGRWPCKALFWKARRKWGVHKSMCHLAGRHFRVIALSSDQTAISRNPLAWVPTWIVQSLAADRCRYHEVSHWFGNPGKTEWFTDSTEYPISKGSKSTRDLVGHFEWPNLLNENTLKYCIAWRTGKGNTPNVLVATVNAFQPREDDRYFADDISSAFYWMKTFVLSFKFHWYLFVRFQFTINEHWLGKWPGEE